MSSSSVAPLLRRMPGVLSVLVAVLLITVLLTGPTASTCFAQADQGSLSLAAPIADHMVLQHGKSTSVWGVAEPEAKVTIEFAGQNKSAVADKNGNWKAELSPLKVSAEPQSMTVKSGDQTLSVNDILVGEVWTSCW